MQSSRVGTQVPRGTYSSPSYLLKSVHIDYLLHQVRLYVFPGLLPPRERVFALIPIKEKCQSCVGKRGGGLWGIPYNTYQPEVGVLGAEVGNLRGEGKVRIAHRDRYAVGPRKDTRTELTVKQKVSPESAGVLYCACIGRCMDNSQGNRSEQSPALEEKQ